MNEYYKNYKILFISINSVWRYGNIGMDQLLGYLRDKGFEIDIKYFKNRESAEEIYKQLLGIYDLYAFSVNIANYTKCVNIAKMIKNENPKSIIDFGGGYPTRYYREIYKETNIADYMVLGDGEHPSEYLFHCLAKRKQYPFFNIKIKHDSIVTEKDMENKKDYFNKEITWNPAYDYYEKDDNFINSRKVHCIQIKNNVCTGNCSFCTERHGKVTYKSIKLVVDQIEYVYRKYKVQKIYFTDDNILDPNTEEAKVHLKKLCLELKQRRMKLSYQCYIKAFSLSDTQQDHELLSLMREVGFVEVFVGIESGNQEDLDLYNKFTTVKQNYDIIRLLKEHDIFPIMGFISFNPYSTREKIKKNFKYLCDNQCTYLHNYLYSFTVINKYTKLYEKIKKDGLLLSNEDQYVDVDFSYEDNSVEEVLNYVKEEMLPRLGKIDYELDWVMYSEMEHEVCYPDRKFYRMILEKQKEKDALWIKEHLKILFEEFSVEKFKKSEEEFWDYFKKEEDLLRPIYEKLIKLHYE